MPVRYRARASAWLANDRARLPEVPQEVEQLRAEEGGVRGGRSRPRALLRFAYRNRGATELQSATAAPQWFRPVPSHTARIPASSNAHVMSSRELAPVGLLALHPC
jgi:hypothetical protein